MSSSLGEAYPHPLDAAARDRASHDLHAATRAEQRTARTMGGWFLGTFVFSIPAFWFYDPLLSHARYITGTGQDLRVAVGALLEILLAICGVASAVVIYPIAKRISDSIALGYFAARMMEAVLILIGVVSLMSVLSLRHHHTTGSATSATVEVARSLLALHEQTALLGPQFCAGLGNGILLGYLMWRSRLLPRPLVIFGLTGGPLALLGGIGVLLGAWSSPSSPLTALTALEVIWELSLSLWLLAAGFRPSPILTGPRTSPPNPSGLAAD